MRTCNCSGNCAPQSIDISRRNFIELVGVGTAATMLASRASAEFELPTDELGRWKKELFQPAQPMVYLSGKHGDARLHLGGIGTGNFEIGSDGRLTTWQLFNTLRDGDVPFYFAAKSGGKTKLLQTVGGPEWPRIGQIEMTGEYPFATLRFRDAELPVQIELTAFSPFAPLETKLSSMPLAAFVFRIQNPTAQEQVVSLGAFLQNPVGYDAIGRISNDTHPNLGGNITEPFQEGGATGLAMRAQPGQEPTLDKPVTICTLFNLHGLQLSPVDRPKNLQVEVLAKEPVLKSKPADPAHTVIWLENAAADLPGPLLASALEAVKTGATLVFSGRNMGLLQSYATATGGKPLGQAAGRPDIIFEDFEGTYDKWKVEGTAFGKGPAQGAKPGQQTITGYVGKGFVTSFEGGDDSTGKLTSAPFVIERNFIRFLVGGGRHAETQVRLVIGGKIVRAVSGKEAERLEPVLWDVHDLAGQHAQLEIVDDRKGGWGHINVDQIEFSDQPGNRSVMAILEELLPARFSRIRVNSAANSAKPAVEFEGLELREGARRDEKHNSLTRPVGQGQVVLVQGPILDPAKSEMMRPRQAAYALLCELVGAKYTEATGTLAIAPGFGTIALATTGPNASLQTDAGDWKKLFETFSAQGRFDSPAEVKPNAPTPTERTVTGALTSTVTVPAGGSVEVPFFFGWHYPNKYNESGVAMGCHYATLWTDARAVVRDAVANFTALREKTDLFRKTFYDSSLPYWLLDAVTANAAILRHIGVVFRIANGDIYGWEGSNGCCGPTCTHVWGYEQSLARLFPDLEREMRRIDFKNQQCPDGGVNNRTAVPSPGHPTGEHPFIDGHASSVLKAYREALNAPDDAFFKDYWPHVKNAVDYMIGRDAKLAGGQPCGVLQDDQLNTYDEALHGITTFISGYYLAGLRAGEEWARRMGDNATADRFHAVFEKGQKKLVELCWNGEYFQQHLPDYMTRAGEVGPGCMADQLIGQWWAHQLGLGYILPKEMVVTALRSMFKYNFKTDLTGWKHIPRAFAGAKDKGLIICTWPKGGRPPHVMLYSDEVWTGIEYQVAAHMIYEGMVEEGLAVVKAVRERYDGVPRPPIQRNPWNEIECGGHYARAMASWSLLLALSGFEYDSLLKQLRFGPRHGAANFKSFFCGPQGWGSVAQKVEDQFQKQELTVKSGQLALKSLEVALAGKGKPAKVTVTVAGKELAAKLNLTEGSAKITLDSEAIVKEGQSMEIALA